ncbi:MAG TPA: nicotinate-nucleotide diphosphorylase (carboxylating), partial [Clostridiales bacterium]|nr:nicotinate-nucleotide diphosphorylase (carboxylating) [Clostridiales bacterium]
MMNFALDDFIQRTLQEDMGSGDITTLATVPADALAHGKFIAKESGMICGLDVAKR